MRNIYLQNFIHFIHLRELLLCGNAPFGYKAPDDVCAKILEWANKANK